MTEQLSKHTLPRQLLRHDFVCPLLLRLDAWSIVLDAHVSAWPPVPLEPSLFWPEDPSWDGAWDLSLCVQALLCVCECSLGLEGPRKWPWSSRAWPFTSPSVRYPSSLSLEIFKRLEDFLSYEPLEVRWSSWDFSKFIWVLKSFPLEACWLKKKAQHEC